MGIPMQVVSLSPGHALVRGRGETKTVNTALIAPAQVGDWLLVFIDSARDIISPERAAEVNATLDLVATVMCGLDGSAPAGFDLPSAMSADQLAALAGLPAAALSTLPSNRQDLP
jgi:hydrogenase expression/formation protein HypC